MLILDQNDETGWYTSLYENDKYIGELVNTHNPRLCEGRGCAIHNHPSGHRLNMQPMVWANENGEAVLERICVHGIHHPDADSAVYLESVGQEYLNEHDCDGCC